LALLLLGLGLLGLGWTFRHEAAAAVRVWNSSSAYNHCWLVPLIAAWLAWTRRHRLDGLQPRPSPWLTLLALPVSLSWLAAERLGIMEGRQITALALAHILLLAVLGWRIYRPMAAPLLYLIFLVPFGAFTVPVLQQITARIIDVGLGLAGIPHYVDEFIIEIPAGSFLVAEACAGLRFLTATLAFGALYAAVMFRSPARRLTVLLLALVVPIVANGLRAFGIVLLGHYLGSAEAAVADHILYGWFFFSIVLLLLILAGLPFREDRTPAVAHPEPIPAVTAPRLKELAATAALALGLAAAGPAVSLSLQQSAARAPQRVAAHLITHDGCELEADGIVLRCGHLVAEARMIVFPPQVSWGAVSMERARATGANDQDILFSVRSPGGSTWQARQSRDTATTVAVAVWLNGRPAVGGLRSRVEQAWNSLGGGGGVPVLVVLTLQQESDPLTVPNSQQHQRTLLEALLRAQGDEFGARAAALSACQGKRCG
jgi:exosortase A